MTLIDWESGTGTTRHAELQKWDLHIVIAQRFDNHMLPTTISET